MYFFELGSERVNRPPTQSTRRRRLSTSPESWHHTIKSHLVTSHKPYDFTAQYSADCLTGAGKASEDVHQQGATQTRRAVYAVERPAHQPGQLTHGLRLPRILQQKLTEWNYSTFGYFIRILTWYIGQNGAATHPGTSEDAGAKFES